MLKKLHGLHLHATHTQMYLSVCDMRHMNIENVCVCVCVCLSLLHPAAVFVFCQLNFHYETHLI